MSFRTEREIESKSTRIGLEIRSSQFSVRAETAVDVGFLLWWVPLPDITEDGFGLDTEASWVGMVSLQYSWLVIMVILRQLVLPG